MNSRFSAKFKESYTLWISAFIEWLLLLPVWLVLQTYLQTEGAAVRWIYVLPLMVAGGLLLRHPCSRMWQKLLAALLLGLLAGGLCGTLSLTGIPLVAGAAVCAGLAMTAASRVNRFRIYAAGITLYFVASIAFSRIPALQPSIAALTWCGSLCLVLVLLDSNSSHLRYSSLNGNAARLPAGLRRHNRLFVAGFILLAAVLAAGGGKAAGTLLWTAARLFFTWISRLFAGSEAAPPPEEAPPAGLPELPAAEGGKPGLLSAILNIGFYVAAAAAILALLYYALRWLYRNTGGMWRKAVDWLLTLLRRESPAAAAGYQDEETSLFHWEQTVQGFRNYWRNRLIPPGRKDRWEGMNGSRERIRWIYRHWLRAKHADGYEVKAHLTPQETMADVAAWTETQKRQHKLSGSEGQLFERLLGYYNRARYANEEVPEPSAEEVKALKEQLKL